MRKCLLGTLVAGGLALVTGGGPTPPAPRMLVLFREPAAAAQALEALPADRQVRIEALKQRAAATQTRFLAETVSVMAGHHQVESFWLVNALAIDLSEGEAMALRGHPEVAAVVPDVAIQLEEPVPSTGPSAPGDTDEATWGLHAIRAREARARHGVDGTGVVMGILDTGFDPDHPDLKGKLMRFKDFVQQKGGAYDDNGHGTHCAGTIGGGKASGMEIGVAPGVTFVAGKIFTRHGGSTMSVILRGMEWVVDPDGKPNSGDEPRLVSNSWGGPPGAEVFRDATRNWVRLGIFPVFAAGNRGPGPRTVGVPGGYPESLAVGASTVETRIAVFSSRGPVVFDGKELVKPDVAAPGQDVTSSVPGGGYRAFSGTSMACPHVAGVTALLLQKNPKLDMDDLRYVLEETAVQHGQGEKNSDWGSGLIDAVKALDLLEDGPPTR